ncbi:MAG: very short patch repair endonuclease, partial [Flavobacterium sp.]
VLPKYKTVIFIHGCFWHGHSTCGTYLMPKSNEKFWSDKIINNVQRDKRNLKAR